MEQEFRENKKQEVRNKKPEKSCLLLLITSCLLLLVSCFFLVDSVNAKECAIMEPDVLKKYINNGTIYKMFVFDIRPQFDMKMKRIARAIPASLEDIKNELVDKVDELIGKDIVLVGEDTESAKNVCKYMITKDYGIRNIYVLKGGMEKWDGPIAEDFSKVECKLITSGELINIIKANRKIEIIDKRPAEEYHEGHIPEARLGRMGGSGNKEQFSIKKNLRELDKRKKWEQENVTVIYVYPNEFQAMRDCRYERYWTWGYKNIYVLRGGMKTWEGEVEKDYLEILKKKVKERLK